MQEKAPRGRGTAFGVVGAILGALVCFVLAVGSVSALGQPHRSPAGVLVVFALVFTIGLILLVRLAIHLEHGLRGASQLLPQPSHIAADGPDLPQRRRHPKNGPAGRVFALVLAVAFIAFMVAVSVTAHARSARSAYTQHHGVIRSGVVTTVHRIHHSSRSSSYNTYDYDVLLASPVNGVDTTRVHDPSQNYRDYDVADRLTVLVDPHQASYAEIPGRPDASSYWWIAPALFGGIFLLWGGLLGWEMYRHRRHKHASRQQTPGGLVSTPWPTD